MTHFSHSSPRFPLSAPTSVAHSSQFAFRVLQSTRGNIKRSTLGEFIYARVETANPKP
jgi:hypothetical protein